MTSGLWGESGGNDGGKEKGGGYGYGGTKGEKIIGWRKGGKGFFFLLIFWFFLGCIISQVLNGAGKDGERRGGGFNGRREGKGEK